MSQNSYPSPVSSSSPASSQNAISGTSRPFQDSNFQGETTNTQRSLHNASAALEAAYNRIRQVRRSLLQLSDRLPDPIMQPSLRDHFGPDHEAIVLAGGPTDDPTEYNAHDRFDDSLEAWMIPDFRDSVPEPQNPLGQIVEESNPATLSSDNSRQFIPPNSDSPASPLHRNIRPLSLDPQSSRYRELSLHDDSATALGRRVAARELAAASGNLPFPEDRNNNLPSFSDYIRPFGRPRRADTGRLNPLVEEFLPSSQDNRNLIATDLNELRRLNQIQGQLSPSTHPPLSPWRQESRRRRSVRPDTRQSTRPSTSDHSGRLSVLSNFSVQNFATPTSSSLSHPLIFEEPGSYTQSPEQVILDGNTTVEDIPFGRNYVIRRRMNTEGEERVQSINLEWNDEDSSLWVMPQENALASASDTYLPRRISNFNDRALRADNFQNTSPAAPSEVSTRRRGWARLDPDGNEIPSEEEEELERSRAEYRVQALLQSRQVTSAVVGSNGQNPSTQTHRQLSGMEVSSLDRRVFRGSVMDSVAHINDSYQRSHHGHWASSTGDGTPSFCANPLPMPLQSMQPHKRDADHEIIIIVPKYASFAGR